MTEETPASSSDATMPAVVIFMTLIGLAVRLAGGNRRVDLVRRGRFLRLNENR